MTHLERIIPTVKLNLKLLKWSSCDYINAYIIVKQTLTMPGAAVNNVNKNRIIRNCAPFTSCMSEINSAQLDNVKDIVVAIMMYNLIESSDKYLNTSGIYDNRIELN